MLLQAHSLSLKTQARTARCYPPRLSHCGDGPAKHGSSGFFASLHTHIYRCQGLHWRSWCYFLPFPTGSRWRTAPWLSRSGRDLQTDIVRVRAGLQLDGHMLRQQRVGIDQSHYVPVPKPTSISQHERVFRDAQRSHTNDHSKGRGDSMPHTFSGRDSIAVAK